MWGFGIAAGGARLAASRRESRLRRQRCSMCCLSLELLVLGASVQPSLLQSRACACGMWRAGKVDESVERLGKSCFDTCDQSDPLWKISDCYLVCYINTLVSTAPACATAAVLLLLLLLLLLPLSPTRLGAPWPGSAPSASVCPEFLRVCVRTSACLLPFGATGRRPWLQHHQDG